MKFDDGACPKAIRWDLAAELEVIAFEGCRQGFQAGAPAAFANFVRVDEIIGGLVTFGAFDGHGSGHAANVEPASTRLPFHPFSEFPGDVSAGSLGAPVAWLIGRKKKRPRT